jgi:hypothetical protein
MLRLDLPVEPCQGALCKPQRSWPRHAPAPPRLGGAIAVSCSISYRRAQKKRSKTTLQKPRSLVTDTRKQKVGLRSQDPSLVLALSRFLAVGPRGGLVTGVSVSPLTRNQSNERKRRTRPSQRALARTEAASHDEAGSLLPHFSLRGMGRFDRSDHGGVDRGIDSDRNPVG